MVVPLIGEIAEKATEIAFEHDLPAVDALIYTSAFMRDALLVTLDNDLRGLKNVIIPE